MPTVETLASAFAEEFLTGHYRPLAPEDLKRRDQLVVVMLAFAAQVRRVESSDRIREAYRAAIRDECASHVAEAIIRFAEERI